MKLLLNPPTEEGPVGMSIHQKTQEEILSGNSLQIYNKSDNLTIDLTWRVRDCNLHLLRKSLIPFMVFLY